MSTEAGGGRREAGRRRSVGHFAVLTGVVLLVTGCAAGSPGIVAPDTPPAPTAAAMSEEPVSPPEIERPALADAYAADVAAVSVANPPVDVEASSAGAAAFARDVPEIAAPEAMSAPATDEAVGGLAAVPVTQTTRPPPPPDPGTGVSQLIEGGANDRLEVALTFDAGADTGYAAQILDLLATEGIPATFGMTGQWAEANPDLVRRMASEGHQLINHTWDHASLTGANTGLPPQTPEQIAEQLASTEAIVSDLTGGYQMRPYFRPPYGDYDEPTLRYLSDNGYYLTIWWTCDSHGWAGWGSQEIIDYCTTNIRSDEIMLLHVGNAAAGDFEALPGLIQFFRDNGYAFVTVEQMLQA